MTVSPNGYTDDFGPNVAQILAQGSRLIHGKVPVQVRAQLRAAVKAGVLGHFKKDGLRPEAFYHPYHRASAAECRDREARYAIDCIRKVVDHPLARLEGSQ